MLRSSFFRHPSMFFDNKKSPEVGADLNRYLLPGLVPCFVIVYSFGGKRCVQKEWYRLISTRTCEKAVGFILMCYVLSKSILELTREQHIKNGEKVERCLEREKYNVRHH